MNGQDSLQEQAPDPWWTAARIPWDQPEPQETLELLSDAYDSLDDIHHLADTSGIPRKKVVLEGVTAWQAWKNLLVAAASGDQAEDLFGRVMADETRKAFWPELERLLGDSRPLVDETVVARYGMASSRVTDGRALQTIGTSIVDAEQREPEPGLQRIVDPSSGLEDPAALIASLVGQLRRTAMVEVGARPRGTGFLVGPAHLLTNAHVVGGTGVDGDVELPDVVAVFDIYAGDAASAAERGRRVAGHVVAHSPPTDSEALGDASDWEAPTDRLDYALVELDEPVAEQPGGGLGRVPDGATKRGYFTLSTLASDIASARLLTIVQHPLGLPLLASRGRPPFRMNRPAAEATRVRYKANTLEGSSGSSVVDDRGRLVALHHFGAVGTNQGVAIAAIANDLAERHPDLVPLTNT